MVIDRNGSVDEAPVNRGMFAVSGEQRGATVHLRLAGELDIATSPLLEDWLAEAERTDTPTIVIDLENVTFIDTSGVQVFLRAADRATRARRNITIVNAPRVARRLLQLSRSTSLLAPAHPVFPSAAVDRHHSADVITLP